MSQSFIFDPGRQDLVDFVIPSMQRDISLCIDPFLLYKSKRSDYQEFHNIILSVFAEAFESFHHKGFRAIDYLIEFPEVDEIRFGYGTRNQSGRGLGNKLNRLLGEVLIESEAVLKRGLRHIEEIQLVTVGVGSDRLSDVVANLLKSELIEYTQSQAEIWSIPLKSNVPVVHLFDAEKFEWYDGFFDLPVNPMDGKGIILVPRTMVRQLPWINYHDFRRNEFASFMAPSFSSRRRGDKFPPKDFVVGVTRENLGIVDEYIDRKERDAGSALPNLGALTPDQKQVRDLGMELIHRLSQMPTGAAKATDYQKLVLETFTYLFHPDLVDGELESSTFLGTERRDIIFTNESNFSFWDYIRNTYKSILVPLECKNVKELELDHINQMATYLGERLGPFGIIVTRADAAKGVLRKTYSVFNNSSGSPRKVILVVSDSDLKSMIDTVSTGGSATKYLQHKYREFKGALQ